MKNKELRERSIPFQRDRVQCSLAVEAPSAVDVGTPLEQHFGHLIPSVLGSHMEWCLAMRVLFGLQVGAVRDQELGELRTIMKSCHVEGGQPGYGSSCVGLRTRFQEQPRRSRISLKCRDV